MGVTIVTGVTIATGVTGDIGKLGDLVVFWDSYKKLRCEIISTVSMNTACNSYKLANEA